MASYISNIPETFEILATALTASSAVGSCSEAIMAEAIQRSKSIPVLYTRGTHYEVGVDIGRMFQVCIEKYLTQNQHLNEVLLVKYESAKVRRVYESTLKALTQRYPQYVEELRGIAAGAKVPFFKLFLLHIDDIISKVCGKEPFGGLLGSTSICCDQENKVFLGHSVDASKEAINSCYIVNAHIQETAPRGRQQIAEECFSAFCLPGMLPGMYMGYNHHGFVFTINTMSVKEPIKDILTPRHFLCRALLSCSNMFEAMEVVSDEGVGVSDGFAVNMIFVRQEGAPLFHNAEIAPPTEGKESESQMSVLTLSPGEQLVHCNKFLRLKVSQTDCLPLWSSNHRQNILCLMKRVESVSNVVDILGDQTDLIYSFFRDGNASGDTGDEWDESRTIVIGIFDMERKTWSVYTENPKFALPVVTLPLRVK